jgi:hypothetical protein
MASGSETKRMDKESLLVIISFIRGNGRKIEKKDMESSKILKSPSSTRVSFIEVKLMG